MRAGQQLCIRAVEDFDLRRYYHNVVRPRQLGMRFVYNFDELEAPGKEHLIRALYSGLFLRLPTR